MRSGLQLVALSSVIERILEVLHFVGASDDFVAREFQAQFRRLGFKGSLIGVGGALVFFLIASALFSWWTRSLGSHEVAAMFRFFALSPVGYVCLLLIGVTVTLLTGFLSRTVVLRYLLGLQ